MPVNDPSFKLRFSCALKNIWKGDNVFIKTKEDRFIDVGYPDYVIAEIIDVKKPACSTDKKVWTYTFRPITALPSGIVALEECDIEGIRLSQSSAIISGEWRDDEIVLTREDGNEIVIPGPVIQCALIP